MGEHMKKHTDRERSRISNEFGVLAVFALLVCPGAAAWGNAPQQTEGAPPSATAAAVTNSVAEQQPVSVIKKESRLVLLDVVVTDKKGHYVRDLTQKDFKVYEDNKEQGISSFSTGADAATQANGPKRYLILFFDNSTMQLPDQIQARNAANKFIAANSGPEHLMAVVDFTGRLRIAQNFTANADLLRTAVSGVKNSSIDPNATASGPPVTIASVGISSLSSAEADFGVRSMLLAVRSLAKNLRSVPGRKMLVLFSGSFALTPENESELTATIDACNKANVAIYALDVRGLVAPGGSARGGSLAGHTRAVAKHGKKSSITARPHLVLTAFPQRPGGGGPAGGGGGRPGGGAGGGRPAGGTGSGGGQPAGGGAGGTAGKPGGGSPGGTTGGTAGAPGAGKGSTGNPPAGGNYNTGYRNYNVPYSQPRLIVPQMPPSTSTNQQILAALAEGTGGFTIFNTNDLLGGLERIGQEQSEFYILGYVPAETPEGSCHTLKVKLNRGGTNVRSRSGYCNVKTTNVLEGKPVEKRLESHATGAQAGSIHGALAAPYFYTSPNVARVNLAMEMPAEALEFSKNKGKYHSSINVLGIATRADGSVGARFSDIVNLDLEKDEWKQFMKMPYHYENQFDAAPGVYKLTVVLSAGGDAFGKFETPLRIDAYDGQHFSLGGLAMTNSAQRLGDIPAGLDSALLEDRTPLVVKGLQVIPSGSNRFKRKDNVILYTEIYEPLLAAETPPQVGLGYRVFERATNKEIFFTGVIAADNFIQKGNPVVPIGLLVKVNELKPGSYRLMMQAVDGAGNKAPNRILDFEVTE